VLGLTIFLAADIAPRCISSNLTGSSTAAPPVGAIALGPAHGDCWPAAACLGFSICQKLWQVPSRAGGRRGHADGHCVLLTSIAYMQGFGIAQGAPLSWESIGPPAIAQGAACWPRCDSDRRGLYGLDRMLIALAGPWGHAFSRPADDGMPSAVALAREVVMARGGCTVF